MEYATFGGGCFWCMEDPFRILEEVESVFPGYMGGQIENPTYEQVCRGSTGHVEVVQISFLGDNTYGKLLEIFWRNIDPTDGGGQFADRGSQYAPTIFVHSDIQKEQAEKSRKLLEDSKKFAAPIAVKIVEASTFYKAEEYHCRYSQKQPEHYKNYRIGSGRQDFLTKNWSQD